MGRQTYGEGGYEGHLVLGVGGEQSRVQQLAVLEHLAHPAQIGMQGWWRAGPRPATGCTRTSRTSCTDRCGRVSDPHHPLTRDADPDPAFHFNADPDPAFHFNADQGIPCPASHQGGAYLRSLVYRPSRPPFWASTSTSPFCAFTALRGSILSLEKLLNFFTSMRILI